MDKMIVRHGDMCLEQVEALPEGLVKSDSEILMTGSGGNDHIYRNGEFYPKAVDQFIFGYFKSGPDCVLLHPEHGQPVAGSDLKEFRIPDNMVFLLRKQQEDTHDGMKPVVD